MKALVAYEDTNMYGGAHVTNYDEALQAAREGRDLIVHSSHYDGQQYQEDTYRVTNLIERDGEVYGEAEWGRPWKATKELCDFARTGRM